MEKDILKLLNSECVGCNLCVSVCPVENCITMEPLSPGQLDERTGEIVKKKLVIGPFIQIIQRMLQNKNVYGGKK